jgi:hypothetical protein
VRGDGNEQYIRVGLSGGEDILDGSVDEALAAVRGQQAQRLDVQVPGHDGCVAFGLEGLFDAAHDATNDLGLLAGMGPCDDAGEGT